MAKRPTANGSANATRCCGLSSSSLPCSATGAPIVKSPAGTTTISGHVSHSLNKSLGCSARSSAADSGLAIRRGGKAPATGCSGERGKGLVDTSKGCTTSDGAPETQSSSRNVLSQTAGEAIIVNPSKAAPRRLATQVRSRMVTLFPLTDGRYGYCCCALVIPPNMGGACELLHTLLRQGGHT